MIKPFPYQREGVRLLARKFNGRGLLADSVGLGKSLQALLTLRELDDAWPTVIVCPASVKWHWQHEARQALNVHAAVLEGQTPPDDGHVPQRDRIYILNYDILPHWLSWLKDRSPRAVVIDESHYCQNPTAKRTKAVRALCRGLPYVLALSATPLQNRPIELWPTLNILWPALFPTRWDYGNKYCAPRLGRWGWEFKGATNVDGLHESLIEHGMVRRRLEDVEAELPEKLRSVQQLPLSDPDEYAKARDDFRGWLKKRDPAAVRRAMRAEAITRLNALRQLAARLKIRFAVDWANDTLRESGENLMLAAIHTKCIRTLARRVEAPCVVIDGSVTGRKRQAAVDQFRLDKKTRVCIAQIQAVGTGTNGLQGSCRRLGVVELPWKPGECTQLEGRLHRLGQTMRTFVTYLVGHGTVEQQMAELIQTKQGVVSGVLDGGAVDGDWDVFDLLLREMTG